VEEEGDFEINMSQPDRLCVRVNGELVLDAGTIEIVSTPHDPEYLIHPPNVTMFRQILHYLRAKADPPKRPSGSMAGREGVAAAAVALRWGTYLAVLFAGDEPSSEVDSPGTSRISDEEMARINIEASAALAEWIDLYRADPGCRLYEQLVNRAVAYLPMLKKTSKIEVTEFARFADPGIASQVIEAGRESLPRVLADAQRHPTRMFANALINTAWRNGPVENLHTGDFFDYSLDRRRMTHTEEREIMVFASGRLALGMTMCLQFALEKPQRSWTEQVLPFGLVRRIAPSRWSLTEVSREVRLPG
jgi:hypothetical protein